MSYQVIARKWRPQSFDEVTGQDHITQTLRNAIEHERLHHAYLFSGARGVGKTTTARLLAKALNCRKSDKPTSVPCSAGDATDCDSCREISASGSMDVLEIDAASHTGVENVRDVIIANVSVSPARDRYKVFIIDEVHMLSGPAFNALLKTVEEPPPRVVFIMATTETHKVPETILSRCQHFEFRTIGTAKITNRLRLIADAEGIKIGNEALREIARAGDGSMRDAQSAFDQVISFAGDEIKPEDVQAALGIAGVGQLTTIIEAIARIDSSAIFAVVDDLVSRGHDLRNFSKELLSHFRDLLVAKVAGGTAEMLESTAMDSNELSRQAAIFSESDLVRFFHSLTETESRLRIASYPRHHLEVGLVKLIEMRRLTSVSEIIERLESLEEAARSGKLPTGSATPVSSTGTPTMTSGGQSLPKSATRNSSSTSRAASPQQSPQSPRSSTTAPSSIASRVPGVRLSPASNTIAPSSDSPVAEPTSMFEIASDAASEHAQPLPAEPAPPETFAGKVRAELERRRKMLLVAALEDTLRADIEHGEFVVEFSPDKRHLRDNLAKPESVKLLQEVCRDIQGQNVGIRISIREDGSGVDGPRSRAEEERLEKKRLREIAENDPVVQNVLKIFRAEIVDVRRADEHHK